NDWYKKCNECKSDKISYDKAYKDMQQKIEQLQAQLGDLKGKCKNSSCVSDTQNQLSQKLENANVELEFQLFKKVSDQKDNTRDMSKNTKFAKQPNVEILPKIGLDNTKTRRPQPRSNTKNDRVPSGSKSSRSKNKEAKVEEHHRNLLLSKKNKHISSACNKSKIDSQDVISKVVCAMCKKCLISVNHDVCLINYVNGKKSRGRKRKAHVSKNETHQKNRPEIMKPKRVGCIKSLATPKPRKPRKPRFLLRWSPTGKMFDSAGILVAPSKSESHVDCSNADNACTSNAMEPKIKRFLNSTSLLGRLSRFVCGARFRLFQAHDRKSKASHQFRLEVYGNCPLRE
nr:hypothetical protein [Tanacetum cinerariifolium]